LEINMLIELSTVVQVRLQDGKFVFLAPGTKVNFSSKKTPRMDFKLQGKVKGDAQHDGTWVHTFTCATHKQVVTHIEAGPNRYPSYFPHEEGTL
jgi:hypothetical protein